MKKLMLRRRLCPCSQTRIIFVWKIRDVWKETLYLFIWTHSANRNIFAEFLPEYQNLDELKAHYTRGGLGDVKVKKFLNKVLQAELSPIRERRKYWEQHLDDVYDILKEGSKVAEAKAAQTLHDVRSAMQINYFDDNSLIK